MNKNRFITLGLLPVLLAGLFAVGLLGCPTAAPEAKKKGGGDDGETSTAKFESETLRAGFAIFNYSKSTAGKLGFMVTARGESFGGVAQAEKIADDFLGDADLRGGYYVRNFTAGQTRQVLMSMTNKASLITAIDGDSNNRADILEDRNADNSAARGILLVPATDYTLHIYDYSTEIVTTKDFRTTNTTELTADATSNVLNIELIKSADDENILREPVVLSGYMENFNNPGSISFNLNPISTCTSAICSPGGDNAVQSYYGFSNNMMMTFISKTLHTDNTTKLSSILFAKSTRLSKFNTTFVNE